jgi:hypothetical protein
MVNLPFELTNGPNCIYGFDELLASKVLRKFCASAYGWHFGLFQIQNKTFKTLNNYIWNLENELIICQNEQIHEFGAPQVDYLRHVVLNKGIIADPRNIKAM